MMIERLFKPLRIGKSLLSLLAMFVMLLAPQRAWATKYSTSTLSTENTWDDIRYFWKVGDDWAFSVRDWNGGVVTLTQDQNGLTINATDVYDCTINDLNGKVSEKITKIVLSGLTNNDGVSVKVGSTYFVASATPGEFFLPQSVMWGSNDNVEIVIKKACTITGISVYTGQNDTEYGWPEAPTYNNTPIQSVKQQDGTFIVDKKIYTSFSYPLTNNGASIDGVTYTYSSSDVSVATVSETGVVTAVGVGSSLITATVKNGDDYLNYSYPLVVVSGSYLGLIVAGEYVSSDNAESITGTNIQGSVSYANNILTLDNATLKAPVVRTNDNDLTVNLIGSSSLNEYDPSGEEPFFKGNGGALLFTTSTTEPGSLFVGTTSQMDLFASGWGDASTPIWRKDLQDVDASTYNWWADQDCNYMTIKWNKNYDLWIDNDQFCDALLSHYGGVEFKPASSTLELLKRTQYEDPSHSFTSKLPTLTVTVDGEVTMKSFHFVPMDGVTSGALTISPKKDYGTNTLKLTGVANGDGLITGFNTVNIANDNLTVDYSVTIGTTNVTNKNASNVMGDQSGTPHIAFDPETNTLKLNNFVSETPDNIELSNDGVLTIEINGSNTVGYILGHYDSKLHIKQATGATSPTLEFVGNYAENGPVYNFIDCTWGDGLYMNSYTSDGETPANYTSLSGTYYYNNRVGGHFVHPSNAIDKIVFSTEQETVTPSIWIGNVEVNDDGDFVPSGQQVAIEGASFAVTDNKNVLTLSIINIEEPITSSLPNLTIKLAGDQNRLPKIISADPSATLTFEKDANTEGPSLLLQSTASSVISGFSSVTLGDGLYYESSSLLEYSTNARKFINPIDNSDITKLTISTNVTYPLWIAGTQVTGVNASNVFADKYASVSYANNTLTLKACQNDTRNLDYFVTKGDAEALTVHFIGYNNVGTGTKKFIYAKNACTVTFTTDNTVSGLLKYIGTDLNTDNVTLVTDGLEVETDKNNACTSIKSSTGIEDIDYFGFGIFESTTEVGYSAKSGTSAYSSWYYSNAEMNNEDANLPPIVTSTEVSPFTSRMKSKREDIISDLTLSYDWGENSNTNVQVALTSLDGQTTYASGTMTNGKVTLTPTQNVSLADVCLTFTSDNAFSFVPLAVKLTALPNVPYFNSNVVESSTTIGFEHDGGVVHYAIDYVSSDLQDVAETTWNNEPILIAGPCTVTAHVEKNGLSSATVTGKYFGFATNPVTVVKGEKIDVPAIIPEYDEEEIVFQMGDYDDEKINIEGGQITGLEAGNTTVYCNVNIEGTTAPYQILNVDGELPALSVTVLQKLGLRFYTSENSFIETGGSLPTIDYGGEYTFPVLKGDTGDGYTDDLSGFDITFSSSDPTTATIDATGKITVVGGGYTTIKAESKATDTFAADATWYEISVRPKDPEVSLTEGAYYTGQQLTLERVGDNGDVFYSYGSNGEQTAYTNPISLPKGCYDFYPYTRSGANEKYIWSYGNAHRMLYVFDQPTISKAAGTYEGDIEIEITNLPENASATVYYYFDNDEQNAKAYTAGDKILVNESKTLKVYIYVEGDSGKHHKSEVIEREYVITDITLNVANVTFHEGWTTYYNDNGNVTLPEGQNVGAYVATGAQENSVTVTQIVSIPRSTPVLLNNATETTTTNVFGTDVTGNLLQHAATDVVVDAEEGDYYGLYNGAFMRITDKSTIPAGKNYLLIPNAVNVNTGAPKLNIVFDNEANMTGIDEVRNKMEDVRGDVYDLMGRKVQKPSKKGLYISKGHKVVINK